MKDKKISLDFESDAKEGFWRSEGKIPGVVLEFLVNTNQRVGTREEESLGISGRSKAIQKVRDLILKYAVEDDPVLILGETGIGKTRIARIIHDHSGKKGNLITVHMPNISENLFESLLFGHRKGAFTDASSDKRGLVEEAEGGTFFIDEISEIPMTLQAKLLRFIESQKYMPVGDTVERNANVRVIAATNKDLAEAIKNKEFREDLYYRLQILELRVPPLRERKEDLKAIVLENIHYLKGKELGAGFWEEMMSHSWPGNTRELLAILKRAGILLKSPVTGEAIHALIDSGGNGKIPVLDKYHEQLARIWSEIGSGKTFWESVKAPFMKRDLSRMEVKLLIASGLQKCGRKFSGLTGLFNLERKDYHRFMTFLSDNDLR